MTENRTTSAKKTIFQGDYFVSKDPNLMISTILGSCVAACLFDPIARIGGMNHFLLPGETTTRKNHVDHSLGVHLMELLINGLLVQGADRHRLQAKLFGGARTIKGLADIGARNASFAQEFLVREEITLLPGSLGGANGRRVEFWPTTGRARQSFMASTDPELMTSLSKKPAPAIKSSDVELF